ncbi:hypothetical protein Gotur_022251 [Gossypium turneri]
MKISTSFFYPVNRGIVLATFCTQHIYCFISPSWNISETFSFLITVKASPSIHTSLKPRSSANVTACRHAHASTMVGSRTFSTRSVTLPLLNHRQPTAASHQDTAIIAIGTAVSGGKVRHPYNTPSRFGYCRFGPGQ